VNQEPETKNQELTAQEPSSPRQHIAMRFFLFMVGAGVNYLLISIPFKYLKTHHPDLPDFIKSGASIAVSSVFFFFWNYFVNFRTSYLDPKPYFLLLRHSLNRDIIATQFCLGGFKFLIYHFWAFPAGKGEAEGK